ncbi:varicose, partial [Carabus blaptoides fortunei]
VQDRLEEPSVVPEPVSLDNGELLQELVTKCTSSRNREISELKHLLCTPHVRSLLHTHDEIGRRRQQRRHEHSNSTSSNSNNNSAAPGEHQINHDETTMHTDTIRMVGLRKSPNEPLGLTVEQEADHGQLVVARILGGGMIDRQ